MRLCGSTAAVLASGSALNVSQARSVDALSFRQGAAPLLLNFNENSLGMSKRAVEAAQYATLTAGNRYPDGAVEKLRELLAKIHNVSAAQIILGNGSTEVIQAVITAAEGVGSKVIEPSPTFGDVRRYAKAEGLEVIQVPVGEGFETDIAALKKQSETIDGPILINICNPNNPTGTIVDHTALVDWITTAPAEHMFLIDEAYFEYAQLNEKYSSILPLIHEGKENLVLTRTFSKIYGMAGMRIGYGIAAINTAKEVRKFAAGYNLSAAGTAAALASLQDTEFFKTSIESNQTAKRILLKALDDLGLEHIESNTNFVLHKINARVADYSARMRDNGISVGRRMTKGDGWNRVSLATPEEMHEFVKVLYAFREKSWV
jgi:histidinol-phosphate aminotransferase